MVLAASSRLQGSRGSEVNKQEQVEATLPVRAERVVSLVWTLEGRNQVVVLLAGSSCFDQA